MGRPKICNPCCEGGAGSSSSSASLFHRPAGCPAGLATCTVFPVRWSVTFAGFTNNSCTECASFNATFVMTYNPIQYAPAGNHCQWDYCRVLGAGNCDSNFPIGCAVNGLRLTLQNVSDTAVFRLSLPRIPAALAFYESSGPVNCIGPNSLDLTTSSPSVCSGIPSSVVIIPA